MSPNRPLDTAYGPRAVFTPEDPPPRQGPRRRLPRPRQLIGGVVAFYRDPLSRLALLIISVVLCYVGGAAMFWFHSEYLGEGGPAIAWHIHWLLDSTFAFIVLGPAVAVLLPLLAWVATSTIGRLRPSAVPGMFAVLVGVAFAFLTAPGPVAHDRIVGRGTWVANWVTELLGDPSAPLLPYHHYSLLAQVTQQIGFGLPLYVALAYVAVLVVRVIATPRPAPPNGAIHATTEN